MDKPAEIFDRDHEWAALTRFVTDAQPGATLGIVSGRRRQGKTYLLQAVCQAAGGFYFGATEATDTESLRGISAALTAHWSTWTRCTGTGLPGRAPDRRCRTRVPRRGAGENHPR